MTSLSFDDLIPKAPPSAATSSISFDDLVPQQPKGRIGQEQQYYVDQANRGHAPSVFDTIGSGGNIIGGSINDAANSAINGISSVIPQAAKDAFSYTPMGMMGHAGNSIINPIIQGANNQLEQLAQTKPETAHLIRGLSNAVIGNQVASSEINGAKTLANSGVGGARTIIDAVPERTPAYDPIQGMKAMGDTYAANKAQSGALYDTVNTMAKGVPVDTNGLSEHLTGLMQDVQGDPMRTAYSTLPKLKALQDKINSGNFDLADAVDLKKELNSQFKSNQWNQNAAGSAYANVGGKVGQIINDASQANPEFGQANDLAHSYWLNNVQNPFQDNAVMAKYFKPDDYREMQSLQEGRTNALHDETALRAQGTVPNINNAVQLDAIRKVLPDDLAKALSRSVIKEQGNATRGGAAKSLAVGLLDVRPHGLANTAKNIADIIGGPKLNPEQAALVKAARTAPPRLSSAEALAAALKQRSQ